MDEYYYCTQHQAREEMGADNATDWIYTFTAIPKVSREIRNFKHVGFEPVYGSRLIYPTPASVSRDYRTLTLRDARTGYRLHLLELETIQNGNRALVWNTDVAFYQGQTDSLYMLKPCDLWSAQGGGCGDTPSQYAVSLTGWWGFREGYPYEGWHEVDTLAEALGDNRAVDTEMEVVGGAQLPGWNGFSPRFAPGNLVKIGDGENSELVRIMLYPFDNPAETTVPIRRAENGGAISAHEAGEPIFVWDTQPEVVEAAARWVDLKYDRRGTFDTLIIEDGVAVEHPGDMPKDVLSSLWRLRI